MTLPKTMYPGMVNSPETTITNNISESDTIIYVLDPARVPTPPNLMTLGTGTNAETVKVTEINNSAITVERGFQGIAKSWPAGTVIARNFTEYDYGALKDNIEGLDASKETPAGAQAKADAAEAAAKLYADGVAGAVHADLNAHKADGTHQKLIIPTLSSDPVNPAPGEIWMIVNEPPTAPVISLLSVGDTIATIRVDIASTDAEDGTVNLYNVYVDGALKASDVTITQGSNYTVTGLINGVQVSITLKAKDSVGLLSADSNAVTATPGVVYQEDTTSGATYYGFITAGGSAPFYACSKFAFASAIDIAGLEAKTCKVSDGSATCPNNVLTPLKLRVYNDNAGALGTLVREETIYTPVADDLTNSLSPTEADYKWRGGNLASLLSLPAGTYWFALVAGDGETDKNIVYRNATYDKVGSGYFCRAYDCSTNNWLESDPGTTDRAVAMRWW